MNFSDVQTEICISLIASLNLCKEFLKQSSINTFAKIEEAFMNVKLNLAKIEKPKIDREQMRNTVKKQSPYFIDRKVPNIKSHQSPKKIPSSETLNSAIDLINKLTLLIKQINIAQFIQNSLTSSLNIYSDHLKKNLSNSTQNNVFPQVSLKFNALSKNADPNLRINKSLENPRKLMILQNKVQIGKPVKAIQKQNITQTSKLKQNYSKVTLPQIKKEKTKNLSDLGPVQDKKQSFIDRNSQSESQSDVTFEPNETKQLNKTPKSRFYQLKGLSNGSENDECIQSFSQLETSRQDKHQNRDSLQKSGKFQSKDDDILEGLKRRLAQHIQLIAKLQHKIKTFDSKIASKENIRIVKTEPKSPKYSPKQVELSPFKIEQNQIKTQNKERYDQDSKQMQILKQQLQEREEELKNLWTVLQQQPLPKFNLK